MNKQEFEKIALKLNVSAELTKHISKKFLFQEVLYLIIQFEIFIASIINFLILVAVGSIIPIIYFGNYYLQGLFTGALINTQCSTVNLLTYCYLRDKLNIQKKRAIFLVTVTKFLLSTLIFLPLWHKKAKYPVYTQGVTPEYAVFSKQNQKLITILTVFTSYSKIRTFIGLQKYLGGAGYV